MSYLDHVRRCNAHDFADFRPFLVAGRRVGWVRRSLAARLAEQQSVFAVDESAVRLSDRWADVESRSRAFADAAAALVAADALPRLRGESYPVVEAWGTAPLLHLDRGLATSFGILAFGVQVTGYVETPSGIEIWVGRRAMNRGVEPGKLDSLVGGGLPSNLTLRENLVKEGAEEASLTARQALAAHSSGLICYTMEKRRGLKRDVLFLYDLALPEDFVPRNQDGEVARFERIPLAEAARLVRETDAFKFNINLVVLDFMLRHGHLPPETPDFIEIVTGLRQRPEPAPPAG